MKNFPLDDFDSFSLKNAFLEKNSSNWIDGVIVSSKTSSRNSSAVYNDVKPIIRQLEVLDKDKKRK